MEPIWSELNIESVAGRASAQLLVESDIPVPSGRTAQRIVYAQGQMKNEVVRCSNGRIQAEGSITIQLLCVDLENMPFGMRAATQYSHDIPVEDVKEGMHAVVKPQLLDFRCTLRDQRVHLNAVAELSALAEENEKIRVLTDITDTAQIEKQYAEMEPGRWTQLSTNIVRLREELPAENITNLLIANSCVQTQDVRLQNGGIAVQGTLFISALYCEEDGRMVHTTYPIQFEEELPAEIDVSAVKNVYVVPTVQDISVYLADTAGYFMVEANILLCANGITSMKINALSDLYEIGGTKKAICKTVEKLSPISYTTQNCTVHEGLRVPDGQPDAFRAVYTSARPTVLGVMDQDGQLALEGLLITSVVYQTDDGMLIGFEEDVPFNCTLDAPYMPDTELSARLLEAKCTGSGRTLTCTYVLECEGLLRELVYMPLVVEIEEIEPQKNENGILIKYANAGETFWSIGKRFNVSTAQLRAWNANLSEPFKEGCPVMIMCASGRHRK